MSFDRTDPADLLALKTEVNTDPIGMGYDVNANVTTLMGLLNEADANVGGETTGAPITARVLWEACADNPDDLTPHGQFSAGDQFVVQQLFETSEGPYSDLSWARARFINLFPPTDGIVTTINSLLRGLSRAEVLFGEGTVLSNKDWSAARDS